MWRRKLKTLCRKTPRRQLRCSPYARIYLSAGNVMHEQQSDSHGCFSFPIPRRIVPLHLRHLDGQHYIRFDIRPTQHAQWAYRVLLYMQVPKKWWYMYDIYMTQISTGSFSCQTNDGSVWCVCLKRLERFKWHLLDKWLILLLLNNNVVPWRWNHRAVATSVWIIYLKCV